MKKVVSILCLLILGPFISSFDEDETIQLVNTISYSSTSLSYVPTEEEHEENEFQIPFINNGFNGFKEALGKLWKRSRKIQAFRQSQEFVRI